MRSNNLTPGRSAGFESRRSGWTLKKRWIFAISLILHTLLLLIVYVLQGLVFPHLRLFGLVPLLLPIVSAGVAVYQGRVAGGVVGIFAGILCDISFNEPAGMFTFILTFTGLFIGYLADNVMVRGFTTYLISCAAVLMISAFAQMFPLMFYENIQSAPLLNMALRQTVYSLLYALPIWYFVRALGKRAQRVTPL